MEFRVELDVPVESLHGQFAPSHQCRDLTVGFLEWLQFPDVLQPFGSQAGGGPLQQPSQFNGVVNIFRRKTLHHKPARGPHLQEAFMGKALQSKV